MYSLEVSLSFSIFGLISQSLCIVSNVLPIGSSHYRVFTFPERIQQKLQHKTLHRSHHRGTLLPSVCVFGCQIDIKLYTLLSLQCLFLFFFLFASHVRGGVAWQVVFIYSWQQLLLKCISLWRTLEDAPQVKVKARTLHMWFPILHLWVASVLFCFLV